MIDGISINISHAVVATLSGLIGGMVARRKSGDGVDAKNVYERLRTVEAELASVRTDVKWIRDSLDKIERRNT